MKQVVAFLTLFTSLSTLICCALPALLVLLGMGATLVGIIGVFPQLVWISEHKGIFFVLGAFLLGLGGILQWKSRRSLTCPPDKFLGKACEVTRDWTFWVYWISLGLYLIGLSFAYILPILMR